jgi:hypothetical protein
VIRSNTNSIRPVRLASHRFTGEAQTGDERGTYDAEWSGVKAIMGAVWWLEAERRDGRTREVERPACRRVSCASHRKPRPHAGVTVPRVAMKPGNAGGASGGAKGGRKVETQCLDRMERNRRQSRRGNPRVNASEERSENAVAPNQRSGQSGCWRPCDPKPESQEPRPLGIPTGAGPRGADCVARGAGTDIRARNSSLPTLIVIRCMRIVACL